MQCGMLTLPISTTQQTWCCFLVVSDIDTTFLGEFNTSIVCMFCCASDALKACIKGAIQKHPSISQAHLKIDMLFRDKDKDFASC